MRNELEDLQEGRVDFVASQLTITPDRAEQVDFSTPYCVTREGLLVPQGSSISRFEGLKGKRIAVTDGSISLRRMRAALPVSPAPRSSSRPSAPETSLRSTRVKPTRPRTT